MSLGTYLRKRRTKKKLSIREVCRRAKMQPSTLSRIESGQRAGSGMVTLMKLSKALDVELNDLVRHSTSKRSKR